MTWVATAICRLFKKTIDTLKEFGAPYDVHILSAHRTPTEAAEFSRNAEHNGYGVLIAAAGMAADFIKMYPAITIFVCLNPQLIVLRNKEEQNGLLIRY